MQVPDSIWNSRGNAEFGRIVLVMGQRLLFRFDVPCSVTNSTSLCLLYWKFLFLKYCPMKSTIIGLLLILSGQTLTAQSMQPRWVRTGHIGGVYSLIFTPDGKHFISSALQDRRILVWDIATGSYERTIAIPQNSFSMTLSPDGSMIALAGDTIIYLINFINGRITDSIVPYTQNVFLMQFSESGDTIAWIRWRFFGFNFCRYKRSTHQLIDSSQFGSYQDQVGLFFRGYTVAISGDTKKLAYIYSSDTTALVDFDSIPKTSLVYTRGVGNVALNSNGSQLAIGGWPSLIMNTASGQVEYAWPDTTSPSFPSYIDRSDTLIYLGDSGFWLHLPDNPNNQFFKMTQTSTGANGWANFNGRFISAISPDRNTLLSFSDVFNLGGTPVAATISIFRKPDFAEREVTGGSSLITGLRWSTVSDTITVSDFGGGIRSFDAIDGCTIAAYGPQGERIGGVDYFGDNGSLAYSVFNDDDDENFELDHIIVGSTVIDHLSLSGTYFQGLRVSPTGKQYVVGNAF